MRFLARSMMGLFLASVSIGLLVMAGKTVSDAVASRLAGGQGGMPARERIYSANVQTITADRITPQMVAFGEIRSRRTLELRAPQGGRIIEIAPGIEDGAAVTAGQVILRLDPADATASRDLAKASVNEAIADQKDAVRALELAKDDLVAAEAQLALRRQALTRQEDLQARGIGSPAAVETAALAVSSAEQAVLTRRSSLAQAEASVDQTASATDRANITLAEAERALAETVVTASFSGRLAEVNLVQGGLVSANEQLAQIIDPDDLEVSFRLSTAQFVRLLDAKGDLKPSNVSVTMDLMGVELNASGKLDRAGAAVEEGSTGRIAYATLTDAHGLRPGDFVTVTTEEPALDNVALVPATAIDSEGDILLVGAEERLEELRVAVLRQQGDQVLIDASLVNGREIVSERSPLLGAGIRVKPIRPSDAAKSDDTAAPKAAESKPETMELTDDHREKLIAFVQGNTRMPEEAKTRLLDQLRQEKVPTQVVERLQQRMGG